MPGAVIVPCSPVREGREKRVGVYAQEGRLPSHFLCWKGTHEGGGHARVVAGGEAVGEAADRGPGHGRHPAHDPEVDEANLPRRPPCKGGVSLGAAPGSSRVNRRQSQESLRERVRGIVDEVCAIYEPSHAMSHGMARAMVWYAPWYGMVCAMVWYGMRHDMVCAMVWYEPWYGWYEAWYGWYEAWYGMRHGIV